MLKYFFTILIACSVTLPLLSENYKLQEIFDLELPVLEIITIDEEEPSCEYVTHPEGSFGEGITNANKVPGSLKLYDPEGNITYDSGDYEKGESGMTVKLRGNTSAYASQKPYKIKLQKKADLLNRGDKSYADKNWVLLKDNHLKVHVGFEISRLLEEEWTPAGTYVNVMFNGDYRGMYYLVESIERNEKCRINVSESGFIMEHDPYWWNENGEYIVSDHNPKLNFTFKYPDYEDVTESQLLAIEAALQRYEKSLANGEYADVIDIESFAKWILGHDILGTWDGAGANLYLSKYDDSYDSVIKAGPLWDFDTIEWNEDTWGTVHNAFSRFRTFYLSEDSDFMKVYKNLWYEKGENIYDGILDMISDFMNEAKWEGYKKSSEANGLRYDTGKYDSAEAAERDFDWFSKRFAWLSKELGEYKKSNSTGDEDINGIEEMVYRDKYLYKLMPTGIIPIESGVEIKIYSIDGRLINKILSQSGEAIDMPGTGLHIVQYGPRTLKIMTK